MLYSYSEHRPYIRTEPESRGKYYWIYEMTMENHDLLVLCEVDLSYRVDAGDVLRILQRPVRLID